MAWSDTRTGQYVVRGQCAWLLAWPIAQSFLNTQCSGEKGLTEHFTFHSAVTFRPASWSVRWWRLQYFCQPGIWQEANYFNFCILVFFWTSLISRCLVLHGRGLRIVLRCLADYTNRQFRGRSQCICKKISNNRKSEFENLFFPRVSTFLRKIMFILIRNSCLYVK